MNKKIFFLSLFFLVNIGNLYTQSSNIGFTLRSKDLGGQFSQKNVFNKFDCTGKNISPQLYWINPPENTKSFAVTMYDFDAPTGSGWWHWLVFNIPASIHELKPDAGNIENQLMPIEAIQSITDFGTYGYGGPCPPRGDAVHTYMITVYALKVNNLGLNKNSNPATVGFYIHSNTLAKASLIVYYKR